MGIPLGSTFTMNAALPIDERLTAVDITDRNAILSGRRYEGLIVYVESMETNYQLVGGITDADWTELSGSGGGGSSVSTKATLLNNNTNPIAEVGEYVSDAICIILDYYLYRRTDSGFKSQSGKIYIEGNPDAVTNPAKWALYEAERSERGGASGVTFSLDDIDVEKSILVIDLDDFSGANHESTFFYTMTVLSNGSGKATLSNNSVNTMAAIGRYLSDFVCLAVDYYLYRRTDSGFKSMSGRIYMEAQPDAVLNADKWTFFEAIRAERGGASGVTFSLDDVDTGKSVLVATLDDFAGVSHDCTFYYNIVELSA